MAFSKTLSPLPAFCSLFKRGRIGIPTTYCGVQPIYNLLGRVRMLPRKRSPDQAPLDTFSHVQPTSARIAAIKAETLADPPAPEPDCETLPPTKRRKRSSQREMQLATLPWSDSMPTLCRVPSNPTA